MGAQDDFDLWEHELREAPPETGGAAPARPRLRAASPVRADDPGADDPGADDPGDHCTGGRSMLAAGALAALGCGLMILVGRVALGVAGLVLAALILLLWRLGM